MKTTVLIAVVLAVVMCAVPVWSQGPGGPGGPGRHGGPGMGMAVPPPPPAAAIDGITQMLGLTTDQATQLKDILTANDTALQPLMKAAGDADKALRDAVMAEDFTSAATLAKAATDAQLAVTKANIDAWAKIKASGILTDDQFSSLLAGPGAGCPPPGDQGSGASASARGRR